MPSSPQGPNFPVGVEVGGAIVGSERLSAGSKLNAIFFRRNRLAEPACVYKRQAYNQPVVYQKINVEK
jgi:hypothetical protein